MSLKMTNIQPALSKLKDLHNDMAFAIHHENKELGVDTSDLENIGHITQTIHSLANDYERVFDKVVLATIRRVKTIGKENIEHDPIVQTLIGITKSEQIHDGDVCDESKRAPELSYVSKKQEIIQAAINYMALQIEEKKQVINNHPKDDVVFIESLQRQLTKWEDMKTFAVSWRESLT